MNILILSNCPVVEHQGSGYVIVNTTKSLTNLGHKVDVIPPSSFSIFPTFWRSRAYIYRMIIGMALWVYNNKKKILKNQLIIVYGGESFLALFVLKNILGLDIPVVLHSNGLELHVDYRLKKYGKFFENKRKWYHFNLSSYFKYCYRKVDAIITVSKYDRDFSIEHLYISPNKVYFNEPPLPKAFFDYESTDNFSKKKIITYCGTWIDRKGINSIKGAIPDILRKYPEYTFRIIGTGGEFKPEEYFSKDILPKIEIYPMVESKDHMIKLYSETEIFLFPSFCESFGLVVAEAMFCKCAVVTGPTGFAADILNNKEALVLQVPDASHVSQALDRLITDDVIRVQMANNAKKRTEHLQSDIYTQRLGVIISKIMKKDHIAEGVVYY